MLELIFFVNSFILLSLNPTIVCDFWEYNLVHDLLKGYDPSIRPSIHHNATLNVTIGLALAQIIDVVCDQIEIFVFIISFIFIRTKKI